MPRLGPGRGRGCGVGCDFGEGGSSTSTSSIEKRERDTDENGNGNKTGRFQLRRPKVKVGVKVKTKAKTKAKTKTKTKTKTKAKSKSQDHGREETRQSRPCLCRNHLSIRRHLEPRSRFRVPSTDKAHAQGFDLLNVLVNVDGGVVPFQDQIRSDQDSGVRSVHEETDQV